MATRLITIPFSHYCEKARWALDRCNLPYVEEGHLPVFSYVPVRRAGGGRTVPVLVDDATVIADSTPIIAWADDRRPGALYPRAATDRADALALEDDFDKHLGPAARRWAYYYLLPRKDISFLLKSVPRWEALALKATRPAAVAFLKRALKIEPAAVERSRLKIEDTFERVAKHLADGRRYLIGDAFSVADLTFAALAAPVLFPDHHPTPLPPFAELPAEARAHIERWRGSPGGELALRLYRDHRDERIELVVKRGAM
ncbi:MAG TPA: glutathione S-transferase family protein [Kofleriaceae bacterium]|nr:glutathione S-transferase family protein [Kofleriaceae bacterium]